MKDIKRLEKALKKMTKCRESLIDAYLSSLERPDWSQENSMTAVESAGRLHDCDRHITNIVMELKRAGMGVDEIDKMAAADNIEPAGIAEVALAS